MTTYVPKKPWSRFITSMTSRSLRPSFIYNWEMAGRCLAQSSSEGHSGRPSLVDIM